MKPQSLRPICRSRNPFSPSTALWQHFILPCHQLRQQRSSSAATETPPPSAPDAEPIDESNDSATPNRTGFRTVKWRRVLDNKDVNKFGNAVEVSMYKNSRSRVEKSYEQSTRALKEAHDAVESFGDYKGRVVETIAAFRLHPETDLPWSVPMVEAADGMDRLSLEIARFYEYAKPNRIEALARRKAVEQVRKHASEVFPDKVLEVFGSERTGLAFATSDIDLRLMSSYTLEERPSNVLPPSKSERRALVDSLYLLKRGTFSKKQGYLMPTIRHARYPLLTVQHQPTGLDIQIVCANDTSLSRSLMQQYMQECPHLRQVYFVVKTVFDERGLSDVFRGGFGSYSIFMMLVASIRHLPHKRNDAAGALLNFIRFWSEFDTTAHGVSIEPPVLFDKYKEPVMTAAVKAQLERGDGSKSKSLPPYMLCLRDPADDTNDLGRKGLCIKHVQMTLKHLYIKLRRDIGLNNRVNLLKPLVGDTYALHLNRRKKLADYGQRMMDEMQSDIAAKAREIRIAEAAAQATEEAAVG